MSDRPRYYLTTAIAYANNKPGLHTLYEVIAAVEAAGATMLVTGVRHFRH